MKRAISTSGRRGKRRLALAGVLAVGLLAPVVGSTGSASAASTGSTVGFAAAGAKTQLLGITVSGYDGKTVLASLSVSQGTLALSTTDGLTLSYGYTSFSGSSLNFTGSQNAVNAAINGLSVTLPATATGRFTLRTMFTESKAGVAYFPENQHFYKYVSYGATFTGDKNAATAAAAAAASTEFGLTGYLANISTAAENDFVSSKIEGAQNVWIGGSDAGSENTWIFTEGPDKGTTFWTGCANDRPTTPGTAPSGGFAQWAPSEPNNYNSALNAPGTCIDGKTADVAPDRGEDCMVTNWDPAILAASPRPSTDKFGVGYWNDIPCEVASGSYSHQRIQGYVIEYGNQVSSSSFPSGVDLRSQAFTILPAAKIPARATSPVSKIEKTVRNVLANARITFKTKAAPKKPAKVVECPRNLFRKKVTVTVTLEAAGRYTLSFRDTLRSNRYLEIQCGSKIPATISQPVPRISWLARGDVFEARRAIGKPITRTVTVYVNAISAKRIAVETLFSPAIEGPVRYRPFVPVNNARVVRG